MCEKVFDATDPRDDWWPETLAATAEACHLVHARVGHAEGASSPAVASHTAASLTVVSHTAASLIAASHTAVSLTAVFHTAVSLTAVSYTAVSLTTVSYDHENWCVLQGPRSTILTLPSTLLTSRLI